MHNKEPLFLYIFLTSILLIIITKINLAAGVITAVIIFTIFLFLFKKKTFYLLLAIIPLLTINYSSFEGDVAVLGKIIDKKYSNYKVLSEKIYFNNKWENHKEIYSFNYNKFSVEEIKNGNNVYITGFLNNNYLNADYVAMSDNNSFLEIKDEAVLRFKNIENYTIRDVMMSSIMGGLSNKDLFKKTGTLHLFAVSGFHVFIIFGILKYLLFPFNYKVKNIIISLIMISYLSLTGFSPSSTRAVSLIVLIIIFKSIGINAYSINILGLIGFINIIILPSSIFNVGFQMSYSAAFMILLTNDMVKKEKLKTLLIPISSFIGIMPFSIIYFKQLAPVGILITPLLSITMGIIIFLSLSYLLFHSKFILFLSTIIITGTIQLTELFSKLPMLENLTLLSLILWSLIFLLYIYILQKNDKLI
ncbi:MAG: ComEC/Rec2 family competence protein [Thermotogota bacterium]